MSLLHTRRFSSWARGHLVCRVDGVRDRFALTFDDGPDAEVTPRVLDLLRAHGATATFFVLAGNVRRSPDVVRRAVQEGHEIALHGDRHWPLAILPPAAIRGEVERCARAVADVAGVHSEHYRPPFGLMMPGQSWYVRRLGYASVLGDVYPEDAHSPGTARIVSRVLARLTGGSILILHDGSPLPHPDRSQTIAALEIILREAAANGWQAVTVRDLLAHAPAPVGSAGVSTPHAAPPPSTGGGHP